MISTLSVSEFINQINGIIAGEFLVEGEVSQFRTSNGKWVFFDLKDDKSVLNCFAAAYNVRVPLEDGMKIRVLGYPNIYARSGKFSLVIQRVELIGDGSLKRAYDLLKKKLESEGIFEMQRKRKLPYIPIKIGVIASKESAAFGDFIKIINNRWKGVEIILRNSLVQGPQAIQDIVDAFYEFDSLAQGDRPDVIALTRGGGSLEDLAAFNSEEVVRAIYSSRIPVITGIGHERDITLVELVADVRASTPSNAAEIVVPEKRDFISGLDFEIENIQQELHRRIIKIKHTVDQNFYLISNKLELPISNGKMLISNFMLSRQSLERNLDAKKDSVSFAERLIKNSDPGHLLKKGYSITRNKNGVIIRRPAQVGIGEEIMIELGQGKIQGKVNKAI